MNEVPGQPDWLPGKPQSLEELRRMDALARKLEGTAREEGLEVDNLGDSGAIPFDSGLHKLKGFPARITGQDSVTLSRYNFTETYIQAGVATSLPTDGGAVYSDSTTLAYSAYEINGVEDVPTDGSAVVMMYPADDSDTWWFSWPAAGDLTVTDGDDTVTGTNFIFFNPDNFNVIPGGPGEATVTLNGFYVGSSSPTTAPGAGDPTVFWQLVWNGTDYSESALWSWVVLGGLAVWIKLCPCDTFIPPDYPSVGTACCPDVPMPEELWVVFSGAGAAACLTDGNPWSMAYQDVGGTPYWYSDPDQNDDCNTPIDNPFRLRCNAGVWEAGPASTTGVGTCWGGSGTITVQTCDPFFIQGVIPLAGGGDGCGTGNVTFTITPPS